MPAISLVVCLHGERALLERLLGNAAGVFDDLVVVHDGPELEPGRIRSLTEAHGGRFFERPRAFQQEPHWPFAWAEARHDWLLRLDADELLNEPMRAWLQAFRERPEPDVEISGYTCGWPLWDGRRQRSARWPLGRGFFFHKGRVRFFGMVEQVPVADRSFEALPLSLDHRPIRKSYGLRNIVCRPQAYRWRRVIAQSLFGPPTALACWRWTDPEWPPIWGAIRQHPLRTAFYRLIRWPVHGLRDQWSTERKLWLSAALGGAVHHFLICLTYWRLRRQTAPTANP